MHITYITIIIFHHYYTLSNSGQKYDFAKVFDVLDEVNMIVLDAGKQKASGSSMDTDTKLASTGLTEKQLQLSVEVCDHLYILYTHKLNLHV